MGVSQAAVSSLRGGGAAHHSGCWCASAPGAPQGSVHQWARSADLPCLSPLLWAIMLTGSRARLCEMSLMTTLKPSENCQRTGITRIAGSVTSSSLLSVTNFSPQHAGSQRVLSLGREPLVSTHTRAVSQTCCGNRSQCASPPASQDLSPGSSSRAL